MVRKLTPADRYFGTATRYFDRATHGRVDMEAYVAAQRVDLNNPDVMLWGPIEGRWMVTYGAPGKPMSDTEYAVRRLGLLS